MYYKKWIILILAMTYLSNLFAIAKLASSIPVPGQTSDLSAGDLTNLHAIDKDMDDLNQLNRKLQIEKTQAELKKFKNEKLQVPNNTSYTANENAQTTVNGVAIDQEGRKIAWLQFADGGSLTVNIGSKVGTYTVSDINMTSVILSRVIGVKRKRVENIYLKRVYASNSISKKVLSNNNMAYIPSPILTGANSINNENIIVPPIVPIK